MGKIFLILGILGILLGGGISLLSLLLPSMTRNINMREASIGIFAGIVVLVLSLLPALVGIVLMLVKKKPA